MPIIYRRDLDRPLTFEEMDGNLEYLNRYAEDVEVVVAHIDEISDVAASINGVNAVAGSLPSVVATSLHLDEIDTVAGDTTNIGTVAELSSEITAVAGASTEIVAVSADLSNIDDVADNLSDINTVAGISGNVTAVAGVSADVTTVAGIASDVSAVAAINDDILTVSFINGDVVTVANNSDNITTVATNIAGILAAQGYADDAATSAGEAAASALEAAGYLASTEVIYNHFDERYLGAKATAPTHDNQGDPLVVGALYFDTTIGFMYSWTGSAWQSLAAAGGVDSVNGRVGDVVLTASDVGLENVTNESKATMFDDSAFTGSTTVESLQFTGGTGTQGTMSWNSDEETLDLIQDGATLQLGQELQTHCRNNTASSIPNATVVMATGTLGASGRITIAPWNGTTDVKFIIGVTTEVIEAGTDGKVTTFGKVRDVDTSLIAGTFTTGVIYASTSVAGGLTYDKPTTKAIPLAFLIANETSGPANNGTIMVRVTPVNEVTLDHAETAYGWGNHALASYASASDLSSHTSNTSNPHSVTATQVGLGNVTNESKATMFTSPTFTGTVSGVTASMVGLGNVENKSSATIRSEITSSNVTTALGYTPYNSTNPSGYITGITSGMVTTALGFTPLSTTGTAADSDKLDGQHGSYYQPASTAITTSNIGSQSVNYATSAGTCSSAGNADTLDGQHASAFQAALVSGSNIKTVGGNSLLGSGDISVGGGTYTSTFIDQSALFSGSQTSLVLPDISVMVGGTLVAITSVTVALGTSGNWDNSTYATAANRAGKDFYIYAKQAGGFILSANSSYPTGYDSNNSRKIGGFHCLCVAVGTISGHTLTGYAVGDILPRSVWDRFNRSSARQEGTILSRSGMWVDIYLPSVSGTTLVSVNGGTIADGASSPAFHCYKFEQWFARQGMKSISQLEFFAVSDGANQSTNITGSADPGTTTGHTDTAGRRMISNEGVEDTCGVLWQWTRDQGGNMTAASWANAYDGNDSGVGGQHYQAPFRGFVGGVWVGGVVCGSRGSGWYYSPLGLYSDVSGRGVAEPANSRF